MAAFVPITSVVRGEGVVKSLKNLVPLEDVLKIDNILISLVQSTLTLADKKIADKPHFSRLFLGTKLTFI